MICLKLAASVSQRREETGAASIGATVGISPATAAAAEEAAYLEESSQYLFSREFRHYLPRRLQVHRDTQENIFA